MNKKYLETCKGKTVIFKVVSYNPDLKVQFVDYGEDYRVKIMDRKYGAAEVIKIQVVDYNPDVKLRKVDYSEKFSAYLD